MENSQFGEWLGFPPTEMDKISVSKPVAVIACASMAVFYVAILYAPTLLLQFPQPTTLNSFMIRRFICATVSTLVSIFISAFLLPIRSWDDSSLFRAYGIQKDHLWQAIIFPLSLTSLLYGGSFFSKFPSLVNSRRSEHTENVTQKWIMSTTSNVLAWRNYVVAPLSEELVFRACMIPLLLCGGFTTYSVIFWSPIFFSLAHLNQFLELYFQQNYSFIKASMVVGLQLGYTVIFGSYASFLFIRTGLPSNVENPYIFFGFYVYFAGHLTAPLVAHVFCNIMGLPALHSGRNGLITVAFSAGILGFVWFLFPATNPAMYNDITERCQCWNRYCNWS